MVKRQTNLIVIIALIALLAAIGFGLAQTIRAQRRFDPAECNCGGTCSYELFNNGNACRCSGVSKYGYNRLQFAGNLANCSFPPYMTGVL